MAGRNTRPLRLLFFRLIGFRLIVLKLERVGLFKIPIIDRQNFFFYWLLRRLQLQAAIFSRLQLQDFCHLKDFIG